MSASPTRPKRRATPPKGNSPAKKGKLTGDPVAHLSIQSLPTQEQIRLPSSPSPLHPSTALPPAIKSPPLVKSVGDNSVSGTRTSTTSASTKPSATPEPSASHSPSSSSSSAASSSSFSSSTPPPSITSFEDGQSTSPEVKRLTESWRNDKYQEVKSTSSFAASSPQSPRLSPTPLLPPTPSPNPSRIPTPTPPSPPPSPTIPTPTRIPTPTPPPPSRFPASATLINATLPLHALPRPEVVATREASTAGGSDKAVDDSEAELPKDEEEGDDVAESDPISKDLFVEVGDLKYIQVWDNERKELQNRFIYQMELGRGNFGKVVLAKDTKIDDFIAIKLCLLSDTASVGSFDHEVMISRQIEKHDPSNIGDFMLVIESFTNESHRGLVFLLRGDSLAKTPIDSGALTKLERREIIVDVIRKVKIMHDSGVFHEDIKPHNVTYKGFGKWMAPVSLIDGGSASVGDGTQEAVPKNKAYQSPEELLVLPTQSQYAESWSLGLTLVEVLYGKNVCAENWSPQRQLAFYHRLVGHMPKELELSIRKIRTEVFLFPNDPTIRVNKVDSAGLRLFLSRNKQLDDIDRLFKDLELEQDLRDVIRGSLHWDPSHRLSATDALARLEAHPAAQQDSKSKKKRRM